MKFYNQWKKFWEWNESEKKGIMQNSYTLPLPHPWTSSISLRLVNWAFKWSGGWRIQGHVSWQNYKEEEKKNCEEVCYNSMLPLYLTVFISYFNEGWLIKDNESIHIRGFVFKENVSRWTRFYYWGTRKNMGMAPIKMEFYIYKLVILEEIRLLRMILKHQSSWLILKSWT